MNTRVRPLLSIGFQHPFYAEPCADFEFVVPAPTAELLRSGRLLPHAAPGRLNISVEVDGAGAPVVGLAARRLLFGLRLVNPFFENVTEPVLTGRGAVPLYRNGADPRALDAPVAAVLTSGVHAHEAISAARPLTVHLFDGTGHVLQTEALGAGRVEARFDLRALGEGEYTIGEFSQNAQVASKLLYVSRELCGAGVWGLIALALAPGFSSNPAGFTIPFAVREEPLKYFVVCRNYAPPDLNQLNIQDEGATEDERLPITFARSAVDPADAARLGGPDRPVVLFLSDTTLKRRARGFRKLRLSRNGQTLVENLPSPGADRPRADCIVHVAKPS